MRRRGREYSSLCATKRSPRVRGLRGSIVRGFRCFVAAAGLAATMLLAGCATTGNVQRVSPGSYSNYREMAIKQMNLMPYYEGMPQDLVHRINTCAADVVFRHYTAAELERLDSYARGQLYLSDKEVEDIHSDAEDRAGGVEKVFEEAKQRCPDVFRDAQAYRKANS